MWIVSKKSKYLFVHVPKNAGSSLLRGLMEKEPYGGLFHFQNAFYMRASNGGRNFIMKRILLALYKLNKINPYFPAMLSNAHATMGEIKDVLPPGVFSKYFKFGVVRNPWDRAVSLYRYHQYDPNISKISFYEYLKLKGESGMLSQMEWFEVDGRNVMDCIIKQEDINDNLFVILNKLGIEGFHLRRSNASVRRVDYRTYYNDREKDLVAQYSKKEISEFGYKF
jgi:hypothetical protein